MDWDTWKSVFGKRIAVSFFICTEHNAVQAYWTLYPHAVIIQLCASYNFRNYGIQCLHFFLIGSGCSGARQRWSGSHHSCQVHHHTWLLCKSQRWTLFSSFTVLQASSGAVRADLRIVSAQWRRDASTVVRRAFSTATLLWPAQLSCVHKSAARADTKVGTTLIRAQKIDAKEVSGCASCDICYQLLLSFSRNSIVTSRCSGVVFRGDHEFVCPV